MVGGAYEDQSLLRGGENAVLHPISGGGRVEPPIQILEEELVTGIEPAELEGFKAALAGLDISGNLDVAGGFASLAESYSITMKGYWRRYKKDGTSAAESIKHMTLNNCGIRPKGMLDDLRGQAGFDRLAFFVPREAESIIIMPKVGGDIPTFYMCLKYIEELYAALEKDNAAGSVVKRNPDNTVILFPPPFYPDDTQKDLIKRMAMKIYQLTQGAAAKFRNIFVMPQPTIRNKFVGCALSEGRNVNTPLLNMLEPTYVIYPYMRMIAEKPVLDTTGEPTPIRYGGILFSAAGEGEMDLPASNLPTRIAAVSDLTRELKSEDIRKGNIKSIAIVPNTAAEDAELHRLYRTLHVPLFGTKSELKGGYVRTYSLITQRASKEQQEKKDAIRTSNTFLPTDDEELDIVNIKYIRVPLGPNVFLFRLPTDENEVKNDWRELKFTKDEARFLNELKLRKDILGAVFPGETVKDMSGKETKKVWEDRLTDFLVQIVQSKCFSDERLLTRSECMGAREFVHAVFNWFVLHDERISKLVEDEEKDKKRDLEFRMKVARTEAEEEAERLKKEREGLQEELDRIKKTAELYGVNLSIDINDLKKNPFKDTVTGANDAPLKSKGVIASFRESKEGSAQQQGGAVTPLGKPIVEILNEADNAEKKPRKFGIEITVLKKKTGIYGVGELIFELKPGEDEVDAAKRAVEAIAKEYPGWEFMV